MVLRLIAGSNLFIDAFLPPTTVFSSLTLFVFLSGFHKPILPIYVIFMLGFFIRLSISLGNQFTRAVNTFASLLVSCKRIGNFLLQNESFKNSISKVCSSDHVAIEMKNVTCHWSSEKPFKLNCKSLTINKSKMLFILQTRKNLELFSFVLDEFVGVVGPIGSGKVINNWLTNFLLFH